MFQSAPLLLQSDDYCPQLIIIETQAYQCSFNGNGFRTTKGFKGGAVMLLLFHYTY